MVETPYAEFILESREHLQLFETSMLALERAQGDEIRRCIDTSFRAVHSLKGNAGFLGFQTLQRLAHATESVLEQFRGSLSVPPNHVVQTLLQAVDRLMAMVEDLQHSHLHDVSALLNKLNAIDSAEESHVRFDPLNTEFVYHFCISSRPSESVLSLIRTLNSCGTIAHLSIPGVEFRADVTSWPNDQLALEVTFQSSLDIHSLHPRVKSVCPEITWRELGASELAEISSANFAKSLMEYANSRPGHLAYEPSDFVVGVPKPPILWVATTRSEQQEIPLKLPSLNTTEPESPQQQEPKAVAPPTTRDLVSDSTKHFTESAIDASKYSAQVAPSAPSNLPSIPTSDRISSLRIQVDLLDRLMNLVGELTLVRNQSLLAFGETDGSPRAIIQRLNSVTSELQDAVLRTRMQPVGNLFGRFPRMVRDLGRQLGKQVELMMVGQEVELDKTVLEQLSDPLTHLIRNSVDHGIETPEVRLRAGKPETGKVTLSATAADGQVIIEIRDDGRGIDPNAVKAKIIALGMKSESELQKMSARELYSHILLPGFSTAKQVSDVSGRGVGMDVVKTNVERLEGSLTIDSTPGLGTSMILRVPLTLAIVPCLIVTVGDERFAVPQRGLEEIICLHPGGQGVIEHSFDAELYRLRNLLLPVVRLKEVLNRPNRFDAATKAEILSHNLPSERDPNRIEYILVLKTGGRKFGLLVDDVRGTEEVVVKPMHPSLKKIGIFTGATLMGDGKVALIANLDGIAEHADCYWVEQKTSQALQRDPAEVHRILLFEYGPKEQFALPLVQVKRIESIFMDQVETVGEQAFITIDGKSTRIIQLDRFMNVSPCEIQSQMHLLLPKFVSEPMGILVSRIVDTDTLAIQLQESSMDDPGILGTAIVRGKLSLFLDTQFLREQLFGGAENEARQSNVPESQSETPLPDRRPSQRECQRHVLLVDDTPFFREVVKRYFERIGIHVITAEDGIDGLRKLNDNHFDLVVSDIEMPNMDGWSFCMTARERGIETPFLALTSLSKTENSSKALECGFNRFEEKLDHDRLIATVRELLGIDDGGQA